MRDWLIKLRKDKGLCGSKIAELANISYAHYNFIENGRRRPSPDVAKRIANVLGFPANWYKLLEKETDI